MLFAPNSDCSRVATVENRSPSSDHGLSDAIMAVAEAVAHDEGAVLVERRARRTGPVARSVSRSGHSDNRSRAPRQRESARGILGCGGVRGFVCRHQELLSGWDAWMHLGKALKNHNRSVMASQHRFSRGSRPRVPLNRRVRDYDPLPNPAELPWGQASGFSLGATETCVHANVCFAAKAELAQPGHVVVPPFLKRIEATPEAGEGSPVNFS
jgi:hypothetical protein